MSWWAESWRATIEMELFDDTSRRRAGQNLARRSKIPVEIEPGAANGRFLKGASVVSTTVSFRPFPDEGWDDFCSKVAERPAVAGAVLTGQCPVELDALAAESNLALRPRSGDLSFLCSCEEWDEPCQHIWALLITLISTVEADPFAILVLFGRSRGDLLEGVRSRRRGFGSAAAAVAGPRGPDPGLDAAHAFDRSVALLPSPSPLPRVAAAPVQLPSPPPADSGVERADLVALVADAAQRATLHLQGVDSAGLHRRPEADIVRRAAMLLGPGVRSRQAELEQLADAASLQPDVLQAKAVAWQIAGEAGLDVHDNRWSPEPDLLHAGRRVLGDRARTTGNVVSAALADGASVQLRLSSDLRWWRFEPHAQRGWILASDGFVDPADALPDPNAR